MKNKIPYFRVREIFLAVNWVFANLLNAILPLDVLQKEGLDDTWKTIIKRKKSVEEKPKFDCKERT